jgi:hypothetical protein
MSKHWSTFPVDGLSFNQSKPIDNWGFNHLSDNIEPAHLKQSNNMKKILDQPNTT